MYVETLMWLLDYQESPKNLDMVRNAILEDHLVHTRVLINFISSDNNQRPTDVIASDYFHDTPNVFRESHDSFLDNQVKSIGGHLVHITTKPMPQLKSEQEWCIRETSDRLIPYLNTFLTEVPEKRLALNARSECRAQLDRLYKVTIPISLKTST
jgi:hypothetical protein